MCIIYTEVEQFTHKMATTEKSLVTSICNFASLPKTLYTCGVPTDSGLPLNRIIDMILRPGTLLFNYRQNYDIRQNATILSLGKLKT